MTILADILVRKRIEVESAKAKRPLAGLHEAIKNAPPPRDFRTALVAGQPSIIAEIKRISPTQGVLASTFDHRAVAREYQRGGARAISVLTDRQFFGGEPAFIEDVRSVSTLPVLRKDFIVDEYQVVESRVLESDAILLIVKILDEALLRDLLAAAHAVGLPAVVEVHTHLELEIAMRCGSEIIGINNRDLSDFSLSLEKSIDLRGFVPEGILTVSESGIRTQDDVLRLKEAGFHAVLIGESLMRSTDKTAVLRRLAGG